MSAPSPIAIGLSAAIVAVTEEVPRVLTVARSEAGRSRLPALPFGPLDPTADRTLELGLRGWVREQAGLELGYVEQLYTFGDRERADGGSGGVTNQRVISVAYLALVREAESNVAGRVTWRDVYRFFPWEDWREGRPAVLENEIEPRLEDWCRGASGAERERRHERIEITFGLGATGWDAEKVLDRYELLYEAGLVAEASSNEAISPPGSRAMALDHRRILATALGRLRAKIKYRPVIFEVMPPAFTLLQLQRVVEALAGLRLHKQNFRRLVERGGLVEGTGERLQTAGRPAELFRFRREVLRERPAPGVGLPGRPG